MVFECKNKDFLDLTREKDFIVLYLFIHSFHKPADEGGPDASIGPVLFNLRSYLQAG
jgi:hypothetical protein